MNIKSKTVSLSQIDIKDIDQIHSQTSEYKQIGSLFSTKIRSKGYWLKKYHENGLWGDDYGMLKINDIKDNTLVGVIYYFLSMPYVEGFEVGFNIFDSSRRNKGFATEALNIFSSYLFNELKILNPISNPSTYGILTKYQITPIRSPSDISFIFSIP